jgi:hypothetical protein
MARPRATRRNHRKYYLSLLLFVLGAGVGILSLALWNILTRGMIFAFSALAPQGGQVYVGGFRIKHWMLGAAIAGIGAATIRKTPWAAFLIGLGTALILDEVLTGDLLW